MPKYTVFKDLRLSYEVEADNAEAALATAKETPDNLFSVDDCDWDIGTVDEEDGA